MNGRESLWGWLGLSVVIALAGVAVLQLGDLGWWVTVAAGFGLLTIGGMLATISAVGIGVTAGMLRYDHLRRR